MAAVEVKFFKETDGRYPGLEWLSSLPKKVQVKAEVRIARLAEVGHHLKRPEADYLKDGIYELRWRFQSVNYRILYFFFGRELVVLASGLTKEDRVPEKEIALAVERKKIFEQNPNGHIFEEE